MANRGLPPPPPESGPSPGAPRAGSDDHTLMERIRAGDGEALDLLLKRYWNPLIEYASSFLHDRDSSEDVVQDAFIRVWRSRESWSATGTVQSYLYRIVRNRSLNEKEKRSVRERWKETAIAPPAPPTPAEVQEHEALSVALARAVESLPPRRREIVILSRFHGLSYKEIAEITGVSAQTVANQMSAAFSTLRDALADQRV